MKTNYKNLFGDIVLGDAYRKKQLKAMNDLQHFIEIYGRNPLPTGNIIEAELYEQCVAFGLLPDIEDEIYYHSFDPDDTNNNDEKF